MLSHFDAWPRWAAVLALLATLALTVLGAVGPSSPPPRSAGIDSTKRDLALYGAVFDRVASGEDFYAATSTEQRNRGFPLRPFVTVRPPYLTWLGVAVGGRRTMAQLLDALVTLSAVVMAIRLLLTMNGRTLQLTTPLAALSFLTVRHVPVFWFEVWVSALILLSLACWSRRTWPIACLLGLAAALLRELVAPYLVVMLVLALYERRRAEALAWLGALAVFSASLWIHAARVKEVITMADKASPGWLGSGGWPFILRIVHENSALIIAPPWLVAIVVPLALLGWFSWNHPLAHRVTLYLGGFIVAFLVVGRPNTAYWGMLLTSLLLVGLPLAPNALRTAFNRARGTAQ